MVYIQNLGTRGNEKKFAIQLNTGERLETLVSPTGACMKLNGEPLSWDLTSIVLDDVRENLSKEAKPESILVEAANYILRAFNYSPIETVKNIAELTAEQREEIKVTFKEWDGSPNPKQMKLLKSYGLEYIAPGKGSYGEIREKENPHNKIKVSSTPKSTNCGKNIAVDLMTYVLPVLLAKYTGA